MRRQIGKKPNAHLGLVCVLATVLSLYCAGKVSKCQIRPVWIDKLPQKTGLIYALGYSLPHLNPGDAWDASAQKGRLELAKTFQVKLEAAEWWYGWEYGHVLREEVSREVLALVELSGVQVLARYYDRQEGLYYVLVGLRTDLAISQLHQRWQDALETLLKKADTDEQKQAIRQRGEQVFEKLKRILREHAAN